MRTGFWAATALVLTWTAGAQEPTGALDHLLHQRVSAGGQPGQAATDRAGATVIKAADIRRAGARSIPEALRLVPWLRSGGGGQGAVAAPTPRMLVFFDGHGTGLDIGESAVWQELGIKVEHVQSIEVWRARAGDARPRQGYRAIVHIRTQ